MDWENMTPHDQQRLRSLAGKQAAYAATPEMEERREAWRDLNDCHSRRPMVRLELWTFEQEVLPDCMVCETEAGRAMEKKILSSFLCHELFGDDQVVPPYYPVQRPVSYVPLNIPVQVTYAEGSLGQHFEEVLEDLDADWPKIGKARWSVDREAAQREMDAANAIFGDILPAKLEMASLCAVMTQDLVHVMSMENMFFSMYDYPEPFHALMERMSDDYCAFFRWMESEGLLLPTTGSAWLNQGSYCFTRELPDAADGLTLRGVWGFEDSQETSGISSEMYGEFIFPYYRKVASLFGLFSYGCCEPVHPIYEKYLSTLPNLRKLSVSPWCDEAVIGEQLRGKKVVYQRKPSPNFLGVGDALDEDVVRAHINATLRAAQGCTLEFTQRDVYTIHHDWEKARRYIRLIRECIEENWRP